MTGRGSGVVNGDDEAMKSGRAYRELGHDGQLLTVIVIPGLVALFDPATTRDVSV